MVIPEGGISPVWIYVAIGAVILLWFYLHLRSREHKGEDPLIATRLFHNKTSNRGLGTQLFQWLILQGTFFVISVFVQQVRGFNAIQTGLILSPAIVGILVVVGRRWPARPPAHPDLVDPGRIHHDHPRYRSRSWRWSAKTQASGPSYPACY